MPVFEEENREWAPVDIADAYRDGRILYWSAYQAIMEKLQQEGSGVPPKSRVAYARSLIGLDPGDSRMEREPGPAPGFITEPERMIRWMKDPDGRVIKQWLSEGEVTQLVAQGWSRETGPDAGPGFTAKELAEGAEDLPAFQRTDPRGPSDPYEMFEAGLFDLPVSDSAPVSAPVSDPERITLWMKDPDGRVIEMSLSEEEVTELVSQGWSRETDPHPSRYPDLFSDALVWVQNPAADWSEAGQFRRQVSEEEAARLVAQGWSREAGPTSHSFVSETDAELDYEPDGDDLPSGGGGEVTGTGVSEQMVWVQPPRRDWIGKPLESLRTDLYRIRVPSHQVDSLVTDGWSIESGPMTAGEWARLTGEDILDYEPDGDDLPSEGGGDVTGIGSALPGGAFSRRTRFLSSIGQGGRGPSDPYEMYQAGLFNPLNRLFELKDLFGIALGDTVPEQETFFGRGAEFAKDPKSIYGQSRDILAQLLNLGKEGRRTSGVTFTPQWEGDLGQTAADISNQQMADLFHMALRSKTSRGTASRFASRLKRRPGASGGLGIEQSLHEEATAAGLTEQPFLEWIRDKYNLGSLLGV